jgi:hypothetical protein
VKLDFSECSPSCDFLIQWNPRDRPCGLVVRVPGYRSWGLGLDSRHYHIFWEVGLERGPLSLVSTIEELLGRKNSGSCLESREYFRGDQLCWPRDSLYPQKLAPTSPTSGGRSVDIVRSRTKGHGVKPKKLAIPVNRQPDITGRVFMEATKSY